MKNANTSTAEHSNVRKIGSNGHLHDRRHFHNDYPSLKPAAIINTCTAGSTPSLRFVLNNQEGSFEFQCCWEIQGQSLFCVWRGNSVLDRNSFLCVVTEHKALRLSIFLSTSESLSSSWEGLPVPGELLLFWVLFYMACLEPRSWLEDDLYFACPPSNTEEVFR